MYQIKTEVKNKEENKELKKLVEKFFEEINLKNQRRESKNLPMEKSKDNKLVSFAKKIIKKIKKSNEIKDREGLIDDCLDNKIISDKVFMLFHDKQIVGFELAQLSFEDGKKVGYKPWMYVLPEYRNKIAEFENENGDIKETNMTIELNKKVEKWFKEQNVEIQKTSTGKNMISNIAAYVYLGYVPIDIDDRIVFFIKDMNSEEIPLKEKLAYIKAAKEGTLKELIQQEDQEELRKVKRGNFKDRLRGEFVGKETPIYNKEGNDIQEKNR